MTGGFSWESILEYVSSYNPLDAGVDSACAGFALSALLSGHSTAKYGYLGYLVLLIQKQGMLGLRTSVISANFQKGLGALFRIFLVYMAKFRMGLARMTLYTYATFISGSQLLWVSPSKSSYSRLFLVAQLSTLGAGYAGEGPTSYVFQTQLVKAEERSTITDGTEEESTITDDNSEKSRIICIEGRMTAEESTIISTEGTMTAEKSTIIRAEGTAEMTNGGGTNGSMTRPGCTCYHLDDWLLGRVGPAAPARESCVCSFLGGQYIWKPPVCPRLNEEEISGNSSENNLDQKPETNSPKHTEEEEGSVSIPPQQENARKMRNRIRKKLFAAKLPGTILGTVLAAVFSTEVFIKISTAVTMVSYNLFFWMGAQCYDLDKMENYDITDENKSGKKQDRKDEEKIDGKGGKQTPDALLPELKKAVEAVLKLLPLWLTFASTCYLVNATADSFFMEQVDYLENNTQSFKIPKSVFYSFPDIVSIITGQVSYYLVEQFHDEKKEARWARLLRISIGMLFSSMCCILASLVAHRLDSNYNSASMLWLLPQFLLWGMMKGILEEGLEEFLHDHLDNDLRLQAVCGIADTVGNFLSMILTAASPSSWFGSGNDISKSHLDNYYRMLAIITLFSTFFFTIVAIANELREKRDTEKSGKKG